MKRTIESLKNWNTSHQFFSAADYRNDLLDSLAHKDDVQSMLQKQCNFIKHQKEVIELARILPAAVSDNLETVTKSGAMTTATISKVGSYDQFVVTGGVNNTSFIAFDKISTQDNFATVKARIKCVAVGTTDPFVGVGFRSVKLTNDTSSAYYHQGIIHLKTKVVDHIQGAAGVAAAASTKSSSATTLASNGDTVEIIMEYDVPNSRVLVTLININTGDFIESYFNVTARSASFDNRPLTLSLGDGTYILQEFKVMSSVAKEPLIGIIGDSYACGDSISLNANWVYLLQQALPQSDVVCLAGNGSYVNSMFQYQLKDILRLKPRYVMVFHVLHLFYGYFNAGGANQTEFDNAYFAILDAITGYGGVPILVQWQAGAAGFLTSNGPAFATKIANLQISYPTMLTLDLSQEALALNNASHPSVTDAVKIANKVIDFLSTKGIV